MFYFYLCLFISSVFFRLHSVDGTRMGLRHMVYESFPNVASCFRLLNATHQFGCTSDNGGNLGVIHLVNNITDAEWLLSPEAISNPYMAVVTKESVSNIELMEKLRTANSVSGILIGMSESERVEYFSPDDTCPNRYSAIDGTCDQKWNPKGLSYILKDWNKPMFYVHDAEAISKIQQCFQQFNLPLDENRKKRNLCSLRMKGHMFAAGSTQTCIRRNNQLMSMLSSITYCDPLGDRNIINSVFPLKNVKKNSLIVVTTRLDVATMFNNVAPAAMSTVVGIATVVAINQLLSELVSNNTIMDKNVMFIMFAGESYDYIGSSRAVYDILNNKFPTKSYPINLEDIALMVDINQLDYTRNLYLHFNKSQFQKISQFIDVLNSTAKNFSFNISETGQSIPPSSSVHSFLKERMDLPYLILTNHGKEFRNRYYSGMLDDSININFTYINGTDSNYTNDCLQTVVADLATGIAKTLYKLVINEDYTGSDNRVEPKFIDELLYCYLEKRTCKLFTDNYPVDKTPIEPSSFYVGVNRYGNNNILFTLTQSLIAGLTGTKVDKSFETCLSAYTDEEYGYLWITGKNGFGECIKSNSRFTLASSPAFEIEGYNWTSSKYSTWTESVWEDLGLVMFLKPSLFQEILTLSIGIFVLFISFGSVYWMKSKSSIIFHTRPSVIC